VNSVRVSDIKYNFIWNLRVDPKQVLLSKIVVEPLSCQFKYGLGGVLHLSMHLNTYSRVWVYGSRSIPWQPFRAELLSRNAPAGYLGLSDLIFSEMQLLTGGPRRPPVNKSSCGIPGAVWFDLLRNAIVDGWSAQTTRQQVTLRDTWGCLIWSAPKCKVLAAGLGKSRQV